MRRVTTRAAVVIAALIAALTISATPAQAAVTGCDLGIGGGDCVSGSVIYANASGHFIDVWGASGSICGVRYQVWDYDTGVLVANTFVGTSGSWSRRIGGLWGRYRAGLVDGCSGAYVRIDNV